MNFTGTSWLKFGLFTVGLGQSFVFVLVPPLARDLGLSEVQTSSIFAISAMAWALTSAFWGRASDRYGRRNIAILGLIGYAISLIALITPLFLAEKNILNLTLLFPALILGRSINGLLGSATRPASFAYVADITTKENRTVKFARMESSFLVGTVVGPLVGGFLFLITKETPFYLFSFLAMIAAIGIYFNLEPSDRSYRKHKDKSKIKWYSQTIWPFLSVAAVLSLCQASLLQSIGFYITDLFGYLDDLPILISMTFTLLAISTIASQYFFTDAFPINNFNLLLFGTLTLIFSYFTMAFLQSISIYYLSVILLGIGFGMTRPALASSLSIAQSPENQGTAAGYLGSVIPIGHMTTPFIAMPIYALNPSYLYYFSSILCITLILFIITYPEIKKIR